MDNKRGCPSWPGCSIRSEIAAVSFNLAFPDAQVSDGDVTSSVFIRPPFLFISCSSSSNKKAKYTSQPEMDVTEQT